MTTPPQNSRTPVENPPAEAPVRSQDEQAERTGRIPEVTGEPSEAAPPDPSASRGACCCRPPLPWPGFAP